VIFNQCSFFSEVLGVQSSIWVLIPQKSPGLRVGAGDAQDGRFPVMYLLHGLSDDHSMWMRNSSIERYASAAGIAVVMPAVGRSFYTDMVSGYDYWTYISEELPALVTRLFPVSSQPQQTFVAGLSMGGYGAFKLALSHPQRFGAAASLSGALDVSASYAKRNPSKRPNDLELIFGSCAELQSTNHDLFHLARQQLGSPNAMPRLYQWCGTEDFLYEYNVRFRDHLKELALPLEYHESRGDHSWKYWDEQIEKVVHWFCGA
jgi:S-formylglutathione hydrolase FrmB